VGTLIEDLRAGKPVDIDTLRKGCLALVDKISETPDAHLWSYSRVQLALEASNLGLWDWDVPSGKIFVHPNVLKFLGRDQRQRVMSIEEVIGLVHEDDRSAFTEATLAALRGSAPIFHVSHRALHADGRWVWIDSCGCVTERDAAGRAVRLTGTHADITARKHMERALSHTLRVMQALLETLPLPVILRDADRRITMVNAAWEQMIGVSRNDVVGKSLSFLPNRSPTRGQRETDEQIFATRKPLRYETTVQGRDGTQYNVIIAKTPLLAEDGTVTGIASVVNDISDQKRTSAVLERARLTAEAAVQAKSRFLANMSHELRTPLNGVVGMTSLLENTTLDAKQRRFVRTLRSSAEALITLINDVLDLSKAEAGKLELARGPVDLRRELEQVVGLFIGRACDKGIDIAAHIGREVPAIIQGDPIRLRQVFSNLVSNAVKFTDRGAVLLAVNLAESIGTQQMLEFSVSDTGVGVAPEEQQRVFEAFEQADDSVTRKFGGTGLGLAICRQLVELMDGHMGVTSPEGGGSRFFFVIPAGVERSTSRPSPLAADTAAVVIGMHPLIRSAACEIIGTQSAQVLSVDSPDAAVEALRNLDPKISRARVFIDSAVSANLEQVARNLRAAAGKRQLEVIALLPPDADVTPIRGVHRCLVKPLCTPDLIASVSAADPAHSMRVRALPAPGSRGRALVVEDNAVNQEMARAMLDMLGFEVVTASNGLEGVAAAADPDLVLILMDCQMPVMDGLAAARAIRAAEHVGRHVPIIALTGNAMPGDREACVAAGMDDYLAKPFSLTALRGILDRWTPPGVNAG